MINKVLVVKFALLKLENNTATPNTHVVTLHLSELPQDAKKPRLRLDSVGTLVTTELPAQYKKHIEHGMRQNPPGVFVIPYIWEVKFPGGQYMGPGMAVFEANPLMNEFIPKTRDSLTMQGDAWIKTINDVAEGKRRDLFHAIKKQMKKNYARRS